MGGRGGHSLASSVTLYFISLRQSLTEPGARCFSNREGENPDNCPASPVLSLSYPTFLYVLCLLYLWPNQLFRWLLGILTQVLLFAQ